MVYFFQIQMLQSIIDNEEYSFSNKTVPICNIVKNLQDFETLLTLKNNGFVEYDDEVILLTQKGFEVLNY